MLTAEEEEEVRTRCAPPRRAPEVRDGDVDERVEVDLRQLEEEPAADMRKVTAARVNMRQGPGQNFSVVAKLNNGDEVEILQDPGDGWVKLKVMDSGRIGWMADFLLTASNI